MKTQYEPFENSGPHHILEWRIFVKFRFKKIHNTIVIDYTQGQTTAGGLYTKATKTYGEV